MTLDPKMEALKEYAERSNDLAAKLVAEDPSLNPVTAFVMAGDIMSADRATAMVNAGSDPERVVHIVGSYARWDWVRAMVAAGRITTTWLFANIADLWSGSDPDDTSQSNLDLWKQARARYGGVIRDGRPLPKAKPLDNGHIRIFRGGAPMGLRDGFAWTTDPKVARRFADGAGTRQPRKGGVVIVGLVKPSDVLGYITGRHECEVIVDPKLVTDIHPTGER